MEMPAQLSVHADGWIHTAKMAFFEALGFVRFVGESRPAHLRACAPKGYNASR